MFVKTQNKRNDLAFVERLFSQIFLAISYSVYHAY